MNEREMYKSKRSGRKWKVGGEELAVENSEEQEKSCGGSPSFIERVGPRKGECEEGCCFLFWDPWRGKRKEEQ